MYSVLCSVRCRSTGRQETQVKFEAYSRSLKHQTYGSSTLLKKGRVVAVEIGQRAKNTNAKKKRQPNTGTASEVRRYSCFLTVRSVNGFPHRVNGVINIGMKMTNRANQHVKKGTCPLYRLDPEKLVRWGGSRLGVVVWGCGRLAPSKGGVNNLILSELFPQETGGQKKKNSQPCRRPHQRKPADDHTPIYTRTHRASYTPSQCPPCGTQYSDARTASEASSKSEKDSASSRKTRFARPPPPPPFLLSS